MAKFSGAIGYEHLKETAPGVWRPSLTERKHRGNLLKHAWRWSPSEKANDDLTISNQISIVADAFMYENIGAIRYVVMNGSKWKVTNIEINRPRIVLTLGGIYNGQAN